MLFHTCLYYLSFAPLWILIIINDVVTLVYGGYKCVIELTTIAIIVLLFCWSLIVVMTELSSRKRDNTKFISFSEIKEDKFSVAEFMMSYVLPFWTFNFNTLTGSLSFLTVFVLLGIVCVKHRYFCCNIVLDFIGYRLYEAEFELPNKLIVKKKIISCCRLDKIDDFELCVRSLSNDYFLFVKKVDDN